MKTRARTPVREQRSDAAVLVQAPTESTRHASPDLDTVSRGYGNAAALAMMHSAHDVSSHAGPALGGGSPSDPADSAVAAGGHTWALPVQRVAKNPSPGDFPSAGRALAAASRESGAPLDAQVRTRAESSLGMDLSGVRVHTGPRAAAAAGAVSAKAYTQGSDVYFGQGGVEAPGGDRVLAHELVHVAQQEGSPATPQPLLEVSRASDPAEAEAERGADAVLTGARFDAGASRAPVARLETESISGNPQDLTDDSGAATTTHRAPTLDDAVNQPTSGASANQSRAASVRVVAEEAAPVHLEPPGTPLEQEVYEESDQQSSPPEPGFTAINEQRGTMDAPIVEQEASDSLYIGGTPTADDVQQGGIGDCYFLSTLMSVLSQDPNKIPSMVSASAGGGATVTFWRRQEHEDDIVEWFTGSGPEHDYVQVSVSVNADVAVDISDNQVHGAQLRCAPAPRSADWWARLSGSALEVHRDEVFDCARWALLFEKAFARFSETYGQYGGFHEGQSDDSGYENISGGVPYYTMGIFYGPEADTPEADVHRENTTWAPGADVLAANAAVVDQLLLLAGRPAQAASGEADAPVLIASAFVSRLIPRLKAAIPAAQASPGWATLSATQQTKVNAVLAAITAWEILPPDPAGAGATGPKAVAQQAIGTACSAAVQPGPPNPGGLAAVRAAAPPTVPFAQNERSVPPGSLAALQAFGTTLDATADPAVFVDVVGHASTEGSEAYNQDISEDRAEAVAGVVEAGRDLTPHILADWGEGESDAGDDPAWRRVEITVDPQDDTNSLHDASQSEAIRAMMDLMLDLKNIGTDASPGQRNIYGDHSYQVVGVSFVDAAGAEVRLQDVPSAERPALFPTVDAYQSTVRLRNPHHGNEPDRLNNDQPTRPEDGAPDGVNADGIFTMDLTEFFRNFNAVDSGVFPATRAP
ncbi:MAG: DUF4157 domain-containing protein [Deltaproteobacteria bacterium]|nr:DUF4157 domain-containing protein [Deltaproteobacteria bacterium]